MCRCTPAIKTPFCGKPGCEWPPQVPNKWDLRFLKLAHEVATWSKDPSSQIGAVIVRPDRTMASFGFNGFARGAYDGTDLYENRDVKLRRMIHAEMNAILSAREPLHGYTLYSTFVPCDRCAPHIIQAGIKRVVAPIFPDHMRERWGEMMDYSRYHLKECGVKCDELDYAAATKPPVDPNGINGCLQVAARALAFLSDHERPIGGQSHYNAEHLLQLASELRKTATALDESRS